MNDIDGEILSALREHGALSTSGLVQELREDRERIQQSCNHLKRAKKVADFNEVDIGIAVSLHQNGGLSTASLTTDSKPGIHRIRTGLRVDTARVGRRCERLKRLGILQQEKQPRKHPLYFFPMTGDILNTSNYAGISEVVNGLKGIASKYPLHRGTHIPAEMKAGLRQDYHRYLHDLEAGLETRKQKKIRAFEAELMGVLSGTTRSDVVGFFGVRPFFPQIRVWEEGPRPQIGLIAAWYRKAMSPNPGTGLLPGDVVWVRIDDVWG